MLLLLGHLSTDPATPAPTSLLPHVLKGPAALTIPRLPAMGVVKGLRLGRKDKTLVWDQPAQASHPSSVVNTL